MSDVAYAVKRECIRGTSMLKKGVVEWLGLTYWEDDWKGRALFLSANEARRKAHIEVFSRRVFRLTVVRITRRVGR